MVTKNKMPVSKWSAQVFKTLKDADISQVSYVPDAGHADLISTCLADDHLKTTRLTKRRKGRAGAWGVVGR